MKKLNKLGIIAICVIILSALTTTATFSWLARPGANEKAGNSMHLSASAVVKSDKPTATTYLATLENGVLKPEANPVTTSTQFTVDAGKTQYFRTVVDNKGGAKNNIILGGLKLSSGSGVTINCLSPLKTSVSYDSNGTSITQHLMIDGNGTLNVDWYIYNGGSGALNNITISTLPSVQSYN